MTWFGKQDSIFKDDKIEENDPLIVGADTIKKQPVVIEDTVETDIVPAIPETTFVAIHVDASIRTYKYHVIGGCFGKKKYATDFVEEMIDSGYAAEEIGIHKGLHRISLGGTDSRKEARKIRKKAQNQGISCWILKD